MDLARLRELDAAENLSKRAFTYTLDGEAWFALAFAVTLTRRCLDRDPHFADIERAVGRVLGEMSRQWRESDEAKQIRAEKRQIVGIEERS